jgi:GAF domain-containing protein
MAVPDPLSVALSAFARTLAHGFEITDVLYDLTERVAEVIGVPAAGVSLLQDGTLRHAASLNEIAATIETAQEQAQRGPCVDASRTMDVITVTDLRAEPDRWPEVASAALGAGVVAIAGIPFSNGHQTLGALNLYDTVPRQWSDTDVAHARVLADMATSYVVNASHLQQERRTNEQLQQALNNRVVIEQAKGILANHHGITVNQAFERLRAHARNHNATIRAVADAIVNLDLRL